MEIWCLELVWRCLSLDARMRYMLFITRALWNGIGRDMYREVVDEVLTFGNAATVLDDDPLKLIPWHPRGVTGPLTS